MIAATARTVMVSARAFAAHPPCYNRIECSLTDDKGIPMDVRASAVLDVVGGFAEFDINYENFTAHIVTLGNLVHVSRGGTRGLLHLDAEGRSTNWFNLIPYGITCSLYRE